MPWRDTHVRLVGISPRPRGQHPRVRVRVRDPDSRAGDGVDGGRQNHAPGTPEFAPLTLTALTALAVNLSCAFLPLRYRQHPGSLSRAARLAPRNDSLANIAMLVAAVAGLVTQSGWADIVVGPGIGAMNVDAARSVWRVARAERLNLYGAEPYTRTRSSRARPHRRWSTAQLRQRPTPRNDPGEEGVQQRKH